LNGNRLLTTDKYKHMKYFELYNKDKKRNKLIDFDIEYAISNFIGFDEEDNVYWLGRHNGYIIIIFSAQGTVLDVFKYNNRKFFNPKVAPSGDIYFWNIDNEAVSFYKINRRW
jgi:hypothetical protein